MSLIRRRSKKANLTDVNVNITALLDVMTVLLFFLIKSFTVSASALNVPKDMRLPSSITQVEAEEAVVLSLSNQFLRVNNQTIAILKSGRFSKRDLDSDGRTILPLKAFLDQQQAKRMSIYKGQGNLSFIPPGKLLIQSDKKLRFFSMKHLLHTASTSGYGDFQFVVLNRD